MSLPLHRPAPASWRCLRRLGGRPNAPVRLVCFPWCGAGASIYRKIARCLPDDVETFAVQLPGREDRYRERSHRRMDQVVAEIHDDLVPLCDRPLFLFGHSMGAVVAHESALALRRRLGREPESLIVSGHGAPTPGHWRRQPWHCADEVDLLANIHRLGGTPPELLSDPQAVRMILGILRADYEVLETHVPRPELPLSCPLIACAGNGDREVTRDGMQAWLHRTSGAYHEHWFDGDHFYLVARPQCLADRLKQWVVDDSVGRSCARVAELA